MINKVYDMIDKYNMIQKGDRVLVALSGGADSVALLHFLHDNQKPLGITVLAAHLNHGLRDSSEREAQEVVELCKRLQVPLFIQNAQMREKETPKGLSTEAWARELRYAFFDETAAEQSANKIATAHTMTDNAETVLLNLTRGTGLRGAGGIPPVRGQYIRPLLAVSRTEIEQYCTENQLPYAVDETNLQPIYARNKVRLQVTPVLTEINAAYEQNVAAFAENAKDIYTYIAEQANTFLEEQKTKQGYSAQAILKLHAVVRSEVIAQILRTTAVPQKKQIAAVEKMLHEKTAQLEISQGSFLQVKSGFLKWVHHEQHSEKPDYEYPLECKSYTLPGGQKMAIQCIAYEQYIKICKNDKNLLKNGADYDRIGNTVFLRNRKEGDKFKHPVRNITKTVKKWMNENGTKPNLRNSVPLICKGNQVLFMPEEGFAYGFTPSEKTQRVLYITFAI